MKSKTSNEYIKEFDELMPLLGEITDLLEKNNKLAEADHLIRSFMTDGAQGTSEPWTLRKQYLLEWLEEYGSCVTEEEAEVIRKLAQLSEDYYRQWSKEHGGIIVEE